jgi:hypothetical protein
MSPVANNIVDSASPPEPPTFVQRLGEVVLIVLVFFTLAGDPPPHVNESHYLCRAKHFWDPAWSAGDMFLESSDTQIVFIWALGWITKWASLPQLPGLGGCWPGFSWPGPGND